MASPPDVVPRLNAPDGVGVHVVAFAASRCVFDHARFRAGWRGPFRRGLVHGPLLLKSRAAALLAADGS
ncbi:MAG: hypothetical protein IKH04_09980 [Kiritimatiellae bacterium]|nr:hypothetical protein [Kiritimatiellia bacterium]